jgi:O-antigen ligase
MLKLDKQDNMFGKAIDTITRTRLALQEKFTLDERLLLVLIISLFLSVYIAATFMGLLALYVLIRRPMPGNLAKSGSLPYLVTFVILSLAVSLYYENWIGAAIALGMGAAFLTMTFARAIMTSRLMNAIIQVCCVSSWMCAGVAFIQRLVFLRAGKAYRASSTFFNANIYAAVIEIIVLFCVYKLLTAKGWQKVFYLATIALNLAGLYLSNSRTAAVALSLAVLTMVILNGRPVAFISAFLTIAALIAAVYLIPGASLRYQDIGTDFTTRKEIWLTALKGIIAHPLFGQGGCTYLLIYAKYGGPAAIHSHNLFLEPLLDWGLAGTALLAAYFAKSLRALRFGYRKNQNAKPFYLLVAVLMCVALHGLDDVTIFNVQAGMLIILTLSFAGAYENKRLRQTFIQSGKHSLAA